MDYLNFYMIIVPGNAVALLWWETLPTEVRTANVDIRKTWAVVWRQG